MPHYNHFIFGRKEGLHQIALGLMKGVRLIPDPPQVAAVCQRGGCADCPDHWVMKVAGAPRRADEDRVAIGKLCERYGARYGARYDGGVSVPPASGRPRPDGEPTGATQAEGAPLRRVLAALNAANLGATYQPDPEGGDYVEVALEFSKALIVSLLDGVPPGASPGAYFWVSECTWDQTHASNEIGLAVVPEDKVAFVVGALMARGAMDTLTGLAARAAQSREPAAASRAADEEQLEEARQEAQQAAHDEAVEAMERFEMDGGAAFYDSTPEG
jgi:hypothetical protein